MRSRFQVRDKFKGSTVTIVKGGRVVRIDLNKATKEQLEQLFKMGNQTVERVEPPEKKKKESDQEEEGGGK